MRSLIVPALILLASSAQSIAAEAIIDASKYSSLQEAANAIPSTGGLLKIPPGVFELNQPLHIKTGDTRIEGAGTATHLVNKNTEGKPAILIEHPEFSNKNTPSKSRLWRVGIANLRVTGNEKSGSGIEARYIEEILVQGVTSSHNGRHGINLFYCYEDPRICDNLLTYNGDCGLHLEGCHDIIVSSNQFEENKDGLRCIGSFNLAMSGNNLDDHLADGVVIENTYGSVIASNMIEECQGWAIVLDRDCYGITMSANVIAHEFSGGIDLRDAHGCAISANTFTIVKNAAIAVRSESGSITIGSNNFSDSWIGNDEKSNPMTRRGDQPSKTEIQPNEAAGILLEGCEGIVISGNLFSHLSSPSVKQTGDCRRILAHGNGENNPAE